MHVCAALALPAVLDAMRCVCTIIHPKSDQEALLYLPVYALDGHALQQARAE